jgi:hypothetical protein
MNQNALLIALLIGALFFLRTPRANERFDSGPGIPGTTGMYGEG